MTMNSEMRESEEELAVIAGYSDSRTDEERAQDAKVSTTLTVSHSAASEGREERTCGLTDREHMEQGCDEGSEAAPCRHGSTVCEPCAYDRGFADGQAGLLTPPQPAEEPDARAKLDALRPFLEPSEES